MKINGTNINRFILNGVEIFRVMLNGANLIQGIHDYFNREDSSILGVSDTGQTWVQIQGALSIRNNTAKASATAMNSSESMINSGLVDYNISVDFNYVSGNTTTLSFRSAGSSSNNKMFVQLTYSNMVMRRNIAGAVVTVGTYARTFSSGTYNVRVNVKGNVFTVYVDDVLVLTVTDDNALKNYTGVGLYTYSYNAVPTASFNNFKVEPI